MYESLSVFASIKLSIRCPCSWFGVKTTTIALSISNCALFFVYLSIVTYFCFICPLLSLHSRILCNQKKKNASRWENSRNMVAFCSAEETRFFSQNNYKTFLKTYFCNKFLDFLKIYFELFTKLNSPNEFWLKSTFPLVMVRKTLLLEIEIKVWNSN